ncbi:MAG: YggT family protein [Proteobacteria bacterium]|nr:YggT family protein [Pseudomonadota bacterium]
MTFLITFIDLLFRILSIAILIRVLISWVKIDPYHPLVQLLYQITEPILAPIRRFLPATGGLDLSPIIAIVLIEILRGFVVTLFV